VSLEVCEAAVEARDFISDDVRHEARIVRVENTARSPVLPAAEEPTVNGDLSPPKTDESTSDNDVRPDKKKMHVIVKKPNGVINTVAVERTTGDKQAKVNGGEKEATPDSININVHQCQASIEQLLTPENSNDGSSNKHNGDVAHEPPSGQEDSAPITNGPSSITSHDDDVAQPPNKKRRVSGATGGKKASPRLTRTRKAVKAADVSPTAVVDDQPSTSRAFVSPPTVPPTAPPTTSAGGLQYMCEWNGCGM
jgi:hypothetical protein